MHQRGIQALFMIALAWVGAAAPALGQHVFANWTTPTTFDLGTTTGTASTSNPVLISNNLLFGTTTADGAPNYPDVWFTPTPPVGTLWSLGSLDNTTPGMSGSVDLTVTFAAPVNNPRFHFANLDAGSVDFGAATVTRLSGNPEFEVTGAVVNSTTAGPAGGGCEDAVGGNPNGACGTVELTGSFTSLTVTITDEDTVIGAGDGFVWTVSIAPSADLALSKSESADPVTAGSGLGNLTYVVTLANNGPDDATGVEVTESLTLPAGVTVDSVTPSAGTYLDPTWTVGNLASGNSATLTVVLTVDAATAAGTDVISDTASVTALNELDPNPANDAVTESTSVVAAPVAAAPIPTLSEWGLIAFMLMLVAGGLVVLRRVV